MESEDLLNDEQILEGGENEAIDDDLTGVDVDGLLGDDDQSMATQAEEYSADAEGETYEEEGNEHRHGYGAGAGDEMNEFNDEVAEEVVEEGDESDDKTNESSMDAAEEADGEEEESTGTTFADPNVCFSSFLNNKCSNSPTSN